MRVLVVGGSGSGKSAFAERLAASLSQKRTYVATMADSGTESLKRIERHRQQRAGLGFVTIECTDSLPLDLCARDESCGVVLVDDLGNLVANALFAPDGTMANPEAVADRLEQEVHGLADCFAHMVLVGNDVGREGPSAYAGTQAWIRLVGTLCCRVASEFDVVVEVACGMPHILKGRLS